MNKKSPTKNEGTQPPPKTKEMQVWCIRSGLPWTNTLTWKNY